MFRSVEDVPVLVVQVGVDSDLPARQVRKLLGSGKRDNALLLPLVDRRHGSIRSKDARDSGASTKKRLGSLDKHGPGDYSILESNFKDAASLLPYASGHMETMGQRIKRMREARGWNQTQLADMVGVTFSAVSQWERDETENVKLLPFLRLAKLFETDPHYLVFGPSRGTTELAKPVQASKRRPKG